MKLGVKLVKGLVIAVLCCAVAGLATGCGNSDSAKSVQKTVEDLTDKSSRDAGDMLKKQINVLTDQQVEKAREDSERAPGEEQDSGGEDK